MGLNVARLYAGTLMLISAVATRVAWEGDWSIVMLIVIGLLLVIGSFAEEKQTA